MSSSPEVEHRPFAVRSSGSAALCCYVRGACRVTEPANRNGCATDELPARSHVRNSLIRQDLSPAFEQRAGRREAVQGREKPRRDVHFRKPHREFGGRPRKPPHRGTGLCALFCGSSCWKEMACARIRRPRALRHAACETTAGYF